MRAVIQRVKKACVTVDQQEIGRIDLGLLVYASVEKNDSSDDAKFLADKITNLRIFSDDNGKMNLNIKDVDGRVLLVSNFTLHGDCRKGRRPGFDAAAQPKLANKLYEELVKLIKNNGVIVQTGTFAAHMNVESLNDGPVNFLLDSKKLF